MKLYKFKPIHSESFLHSLDMIVNERIYLSTCDAMNDPAEGAWNYLGVKDATYMDLAKSLRLILDSTRFTSFTRDYKNELLWAHYAGGFTGVAFEYELDEYKYDIRAMNYEGKANLDRSQIAAIVKKDAAPQDFEVLLSKARCWSYEQEYRLFSKSCETYITAKPTKIIFGMKNLIQNNIVHTISHKYMIPRAYILSNDGEFKIFDI